jgi:protocatechuate 3,4-dioxygenase beta subunit
MTFIRLLIASVLLGRAAQVSGQEDPAAAPKTGSIAGVAIDEKSGEGVAKALIILRRDQQGGLGEITDAKGKFTLRDVDPGVYTLSVERDGYVAARGPSQTITVQAGQTTSDVKLKLQRTGAVSGRILDADGDPISGVGVVVLPARAIKNARPAGTFATTNDRGEYRIFHIPPAGYRVSATYTPTERYDGVRMQRPAGAEAASGSEAYPTVYYPATTDARQATVLTVEAGTEIHGIDLQLVRVRGVRVRGRVTSPSGGMSPLFQMVALVPIGQRDAPGPGHNALIRDPNGEFEFTGVMPGTYRLQVETAGFNEPNTNRMSARRTLEVGVTDVGGIEMTPGRPASLSGRVVAPEDRKLTPGLIVMLGPRDAGDTQGGGMAQVGADGTFNLAQVAPGEYDVLLGVTSGEGDDTYIHAIRHGDTDALVEGLRVGEGPLAQLEIVLKANGGAAECSVTNDKGEPVPNASIMVVPDPPRQRQFALFGECRTQADGTCKITGITPGEYHVYAFPAGGEVDRRDPDAFKPFEKYAEAVKFAEGERKPVNLKTAPIE